LTTASYLSSDFGATTDQNVGPESREFSGLFGSAVDKITRSNLYDVKSWVYILNGWFGWFSSVVDKRTRSTLNDVKSWVDKFSGSFGSVVDERTRNNLYDV